MRTNYLFFCLFSSLFFISTPAFTQTGNFDETWKEFLDNNKISNMSELIKPNKERDRLNYAKYLLMNTNSNFCQSRVDGAENLMAEIQEMDPQLHKAIPGYVEKLYDLETKIKAFHTIDDIWKQFLRTKEVPSDELEAITAAKTSCEKQTLAKYSYMTAYDYFCKGDIAKSKDIFENRTLQLAEKTTLRIQDVDGLAPEVAKMKTMYLDMDKLDVAWKSYVKTGVSPGFDLELPLFPCNPVPKMKELVLKGVLDLCHLGPGTLEQIKKLQKESGVTLDRELAGKVKELESAIGQNEANLAALNKAWEAFIPDNKVKSGYRYGYDYCRPEPLIKAYIMDGFTFTCDLAGEMLLKIDSLQRAENLTLDGITRTKINELVAVTQQQQADAMKIERLWNKFVSQGDKLTETYQSAEFYCDNIHLVKDLTMRGLSGTCEEGFRYLQKIEAFLSTFEFSLDKELACRVQKLEAKVWDCRYDALKNLARIQAPDSTDQRLKELMEENGIGDRPEVCTANK
ncbi:MAG TPA: hypothetical protein PKB07_22045 [Flavilitoribacter sp.]|nr:hypothetical protein [Flavilitoribacter sp.]